MLYACLWSMIGKISQPILSDPYIFSVREQIGSNDFLDTYNGFLFHYGRYCREARTTAVSTGFCSLVSIVFVSSPVRNSCLGYTVEEKYIVYYSL